MRAMPQRRRALLAACLLAFPLTSCLAGPHQLRRSVDDWDNNVYTNSPWWNATLWIVPVIPLTSIGASVVDFLVTDPWAFWFDDAWDGSGTAFEHLHVEPTDGFVRSLMMERSGWTKVEK